MKQKPGHEKHKVTKMLEGKQVNLIGEIVVFLQSNCTANVRHLAHS